MMTRDSRASATSIDGSGPPRSRAARRRAATNRSSESMVSVSRMSSKLSDLDEVGTHEIRYFPDTFSHHHCCLRICPEVLARRGRGYAAESCGLPWWPAWRVDRDGPYQGVIWDMSVCHTWYRVAQGAGNVSEGPHNSSDVWEGPNPPLPAPPPAPAPPGLPPPPGTCWNMWIPDPCPGG
jgi:hypothetical protein